MAEKMVKEEETKSKALELEMPTCCFRKKSEKPPLVKKYQVKLVNYAWDQTSSFIKLYVTIQNVHTVSKENVTCKFTNRSLELKVQDVDNKDYSLFIKNLLNDIDPEKSDHKIKKDKVVINIAKVKELSWSHMTVLEKRAKEAELPKVKSYEGMETNDKIMELMKDMYQQGDDEVKRIIAQGWAESQETPPEENEKFLNNF